MRTNNWARTTFSEICTITRGASPRPIMDWVSHDGTPWVKIADATGEPGRFISQTKEFIRNEGRSKSVVVVPGDLVVSNSATPGMPKFLRIEACIHDGWLLLRNFKGALPEFLYYVVLNDRKVLIGKGNGSVFTNLKTEILKSHEIFLPTIFEQKRISDALGQIDDLIALNIAKSKTLEDIAQTIFKSWFIDFDPVRAKMAGEKPAGMDAATAVLFPDSMEESELGLIPKGWEVKGIGDFGKVVTGKTPSTQVPQYWGDQIPFVTIPDMHDQILVTSTVRALSQEGADSQRSQNVSAGSTMVTCIATPGLVGYATKLCQTNQQINSVVPGNEYSSVWLFWHLRGLIPTLIRNSGIGTVFANLNKSDFSKIKSVTPTRAVRDAFSGIVQPIVELLETLNYESQCLRDIRDGMLPRLISGELQIPEEMLAS